MSKKVPPIGLARDYYEALKTPSKKEERARLLKEIFTPYYKDYTNKSKGKLWHANPAMYTKQAALFLPRFTGHNLNGKEWSSSAHRKPYIFQFFKTRFGQDVCASFKEILNPSNHILFHLEDNYLKMLLAKAYLPSIKHNTPVEMHANYIFSTKAPSNEEMTMAAFSNKVTGYTYLIDSDQQIRWAACGEATDEEIETLHRGYNKLLQESQ